MRAIRDVGALWVFGGLGVLGGFGVLGVFGGVLGGFGGVLGVLGALRRLGMQGLKGVALSGTHGGLAPPRPPGLEDSLDLEEPHRDHGGRCGFVCKCRV